MRRESVNPAGRVDHGLRTEPDPPSGTAVRRQGDAPVDFAAHSEPSFARSGGLPEGARPERRRGSDPAALGAASRQREVGTARVVNRLERLSFGLGLMVLAFLVGYQSHAWKIWPHHVLRDAKDALASLRTAYLMANPAIVELPTPRRGVTTSEPTAMAPGLTFLSLWAEDGFEGRLVNPAGELRHRWQISFDAVWPDGAPHLLVQGRTNLFRWHGVHLFPNGDLLVNFEHDSFPYGGGLVRVDRDSRLVWRLERNTHHAVHVAEDGVLWVPHSTYRPSGSKEQPAESWYYEDTILKISPTGQVLDEFSILAALRKGLPGLLPRSIEKPDLTHLNDVEIVTAAQARVFPGLHEGDIVVSLRNLNAVVAVDPRTRLAHWALLGPWIMQHDVDLLPDGKLMLFDNRGGPAECGGSRIIIFDPKTQAIDWSYAGCQPKFFSSVWGAQQLLPNGNVLITESAGGRAFEITQLPQPRIVWEYVNGLDETNDKPMAGYIGDAQRMPPEQLTFLNP